MSEHKCQALVVRCMDFRITPEVFSQLLADNGICQSGQFDLVSVAGAAKSFLNSDDQGLMIKQVEIAQRLHGIKKVVLVMHDNCGAYGIENQVEEEHTQTEDLKQITQILGVHFPKLEVECYILKGTASGNFVLLRV